MIIRQKRIRSLQPHLGSIQERQTAVFGVRVSQITISTLAHIGFSVAPSFGDVMLPRASGGPVSLFNAEGKYDVHKDQPMETAYRQADWNWTEWHGRYDRVQQSRIVDVPYKRYPRTFVPPPSIEVTIGQIASGELVVVSPPIELPDDNGGYVKAKHKPLIDMKLWNAVQKSRVRNRKSPRNCPRNGSLGAFTGYAYCWHCGSRMRTGQTYKGKKRLTCANKIKFHNCPSESGMLEIYEAQLAAYLENLIMPDDYVDRIIEIQKNLEVSYDETEIRRNELQTRFERNKRMYKWCDMSETDYLVERAQIKSELDRLTPHEYNTAALEKLAELLKNVPQLWKEADQNQRNAIGRQLFKEVWVKDKQIVAVRPTEDFEPFFRVSFDDWNTVYTSNGSNPIGVGLNVKATIWSPF